LCLNDHAIEIIDHPLLSISCLSIIANPRCSIIVLREMQLNGAHFISTSTFGLSKNPLHFALICANKKNSKRRTFKPRFLR